MGYRDRKAEFRNAHRTPLSGDDWDLSAGNGYVATLERPTEPIGSLRLKIRGLGVSVHGLEKVRLTSRQVSLKSNQRYVLEFRGRASVGHEITVGAERA